MNASIEIKITEHEQTILLTIYWLDQTNLINLKYALNTIQNTEKDYVNLLRKHVVSSDSDRPDPSSRRIKEEIKGLAMEVYKLVVLGLIEQEDHIYTGAQLRLTAEGKKIARRIRDERSYSITSPKPLRNVFFIACPLNNQMVLDLYNSDVKNICEELGYEPCRVDLAEPTNKLINKMIIEGIKNSAGVIADLTSARPSVYFEVGYAIGEGVPVILTCHENHRKELDDNSRIHFDLRPYKISFWAKDKNGGFRWIREEDHIRTRLLNKFGVFKPSVSQALPAPAQ